MCPACLGSVLLVAAVATSAAGAAGIVVKKLRARSGKKKENSP
jgi:hypothetical protein